MRRKEEFEIDTKKWKVFFDIHGEDITSAGNNSIIVNFIFNRKEHPYLTEEDIEELKKDLKDLGKLRIIKQGQEFLEK